MKLRQISKREFVKKWLVCLIFSFELFVLVWLTELMSNIVHALASGIGSGIFWLGMGVIEFFFLVVFGFVPVALLAMWLINPTVIDGIFSQFQLTDKTLDKNPKKENNELPTHDQVNLAILTALYRKAEVSPNNNYLTLKQLIDIIGVPDNLLDFSLKYLFGKKLIHLRLANIENRDNFAWITPIGIDALTHKEQNKSSFPFLTANIPISIENKFGLINL